MTNDLDRRVAEHKSGEREGFTNRYRVQRLLYFEEFHDPRDAIEREKQTKGWLRRRKLDLIRSLNPTFSDLSESPVA